MLAVPGSSLAAARRPAALRPQTLLRTSSSIRGFGQDGSRIAWLTGTDGRRCTRTLHVRSLRARRAQTTLQTGCTSDSEYRSGLALAGRSAAWDSFVAGGNTEFDAAIVTARIPEKRAHRVASISGTRGDGYPESYPRVAGAGNLLAFSTPTAVRRIAGGKARRLFGFSKPLGLAVGAGKLAVVGQEMRPGDGCGCASYPDWRADGKIGFLSQLALPPQGKQELTLIDPSGSGRTVLDDDRWRFGLDWSLDGTKLAYSYTIGAGITVAVANADGSGPHDVDAGDHPSLSPDGSKVAYDQWAGAFFVYVANADGSGKHGLAVGDDPAWSPDGTRVALVNGGRLSVANSDGTGFHQIGSIEGTEPDWSPDATKIAYAWQGIWIADADGSNPHRVTSYPQDFNPHWSPDGQRLVFESNRNDLAPDDLNGLWQPELYVVNADGTGLRPLTFSVAASWATVGQVRSATGRLVSSFEVPGAAAGVAVAGGKVAVGSQDREGRGLLTVFAAATGKQLRSAPLPGPTPLVAGANARWVVFRTGMRTIRAFDLRTSTTTILAVARTAPIGLSVSGRRVAWAESSATSGRIRALTLPR